MALKIGTIGGKAFTLPADLVTQTAAVLAKKGSGKSYTAAVMAEELLDAGQQVVIIDPTGAHWGLRSSADGKSAGFPIVVVGGDHADLPLEEGAGEILARAVVERRFSAILDVSLLRKGAATRFLGAFFEALYRLNRAPLHLICDEADVYAPQKPFAEEARTLGAIEDIVRRGRIRGIGCTLITQRPAVLSKNVLTQAELLIALRVAHPKDIAAVMEWVAVHGDERQAQRMVESLPSLPIGTAWFWSPGWGDIFERVQVRARRTFDSGATPKAGQAVKAPKVLAEIDVEKLGAEIKATVEKAKADDPRELRRQLAEVQRQLAAAQKTQSAPAAKIEIERVNVPVLTAEEVAMVRRVIDEPQMLVRQMQRSLDDLAKTITGSADNLAKALARAQRQPAVASAPVQRHVSVAPAARQSHQTPAPTVASATEITLGGGKRRILIALAQHPHGLTSTKLSILTGISQSGGTWRTYLGELRGAGWVEGGRDLIRITSAGLEALGPYEPLPTGQALIEYWRGRLGDSGKRRIFDVAVGAYPDALSYEDVSVATGIDTAGGTWRTYLGELRGLELIVGRGEIRASEVLFS